MYSFSIIQLIVYTYLAKQSIQSKAKATKTKVLYVVLVVLMIFF